MTRSTFAACGLCALLVAVPAAQSPAPRRAPQPAPRTTAQTMTLTGCLEPWDPATMQVGTTASGGAQQYVLTNAESATPSGTPAGGTTPQGSAQPPSGSTPVSGAHDTYLLKPTPGMALAPWANQQVKVMGTLVVVTTPQPGMPTGTSGITGLPASTPTTSAGGTPTTSAGGTPTTSAGGTPTTSSGGTPTTSTGGTPTTGSTPTTGGTPTTSGTPMTGATPASGAAATTGGTPAAQSATAAAAAARSTFNVMSIALVQKTCP